MQNTQISVFKDLFKSTDVPFIVDLQKITERIRCGKSKHLTDEIRKGNKELKKKYTCCNCGGELIARKGKIKAHHFSHKSEGNCSYESYLHKVSKIKFYEIYTQCLENKKPFYIEYKTKLTCVSCKDIENINIECELKDKIGRFDLTKYFDKISIFIYNSRFNLSENKGAL